MQRQRTQPKSLFSGILTNTLILLLTMESVFNMKIWYFRSVLNVNEPAHQSLRQSAKAQPSLRFRAVSPEPYLLAHSNHIRWKFTPTTSPAGWFDSLRPINNLSVIKGPVFLGWTSTKLGLMCLAQGHNAVRLDPVAPRSRVKHSTTEPLRS